jgi:hypothetical protein
MSHIAGPRPGNCKLQSRSLTLWSDNAIVTRSRQIMMQIAKLMDVPTVSEAMKSWMKLCAMWIPTASRSAYIIFLVAFATSQIFRLPSPEVLATRGFPRLYSVMDDSTCAKAIHLPSAINFFASYEIYPKRQGLSYVQSLSFFLYNRLTIQ